MQLITTTNYLIY